MGTVPTKTIPNIPTSEIISTDEQKEKEMLNAFEMKEYNMIPSQSQSVTKFGSRNFCNTLPIVYTLGHTVGEQFVLKKIGDPGGIKIPEKIMPLSWSGEIYEKGGYPAALTEDGILWIYGPHSHISSISLRFRTNSQNSQNPQDGSVGNDDNNFKIESFKEPGYFPGVLERIVLIGSRWLFCHYHCYGGIKGSNIYGFDRYTGLWIKVPLPFLGKVRIEIAGASSCENSSLDDHISLLCFAYNKKEDGYECYSFAPFAHYNAIDAIPTLTLETLEDDDDLPALESIDHDDDDHDKVKIAQFFELKPELIDGKNIDTDIDTDSDIDKWSWRKCKCKCKINSNVNRSWSYGQYIYSLNPKDDTVHIRGSLPHLPQFKLDGNYLVKNENLNTIVGISYHDDFMPTIQQKILDIVPIHWVKTKIEEKTKTQSQECSPYLRARTVMISIEYDSSINVCDLYQSSQNSQIRDYDHDKSKDTHPNSLEFICKSKIDISSSLSLSTICVNWMNKYTNNNNNQMSDFAQPIVLHDELFVIGGRDNNNTLAAISLKDGTRRICTNIPDGRFGVQVCVLKTSNLKEKLFVSGRSTNFIAPAKGEIWPDFYRTTTNRFYDPITNEWEDLPPMKFGRSRQHITVYDNKAFLFGSNHNDDDNILACEMFDPMTQIVTRIKDLPIDITSAALISVPSYGILLFGGGPSRKDCIYHYDPINNSYIKLKARLPYRSNNHIAYYDPSLRLIHIFVISKKGNDKNDKECAFHYTIELSKLISNTGIWTGYETNNMPRNFQDLIAFAVINS